MDIQELLARGGEMPTRAALIGVGQFGRALLAQSRRIAAFDLRVLCDLDVARVVRSCLAAGLAPEQFLATDARPAAMAALDAGKLLITQDPRLAAEAPVDVVVEATGSAEAGTVNVLAAIEFGRHVVLVTKETDCIVGPLLARRARSAGVTLTQVDGDQPSLLLGLISWARALGFEIACAGKASEHDFVFDMASGVVRVSGLELEARLDPSLWDSPLSVVERIALRADALASLPQRTPPDYCELCLVANGSGLMPDREDLHAPVARMTELPELLRPRALGGAIGGEGRLDIFNCLRRPDEISAAGGVFAVVKAPDEETGRLLQSKCIPTSADARHLLIYNPTHLLGAEAPMSILSAHRLRLASGSNRIEPVCDVVMRATENLAAGTTLTDQGHHHRITGVEAGLREYGILTDDAPLPYFMAIGRSLTRDVKKGELVTRSAIAAPAESALWALRAEQDAEFGDGVNSW